MIVFLGGLLLAALSDMISTLVLYRQANASSVFKICEENPLVRKMNQKFGYTYSTLLLKSSIPAIVLASMAIGVDPIWTSLSCVIGVSIHAVSTAINLLTLQNIRT